MSMVNIRLENPPIVSATPELVALSKWLMKAKLVIDSITSVSNTIPNNNLTLLNQIAALAAEKAGIAESETITKEWDFALPPKIEADPTDNDHAVRKSFADGLMTAHNSAFNHSKINVSGTSGNVLKKGDSGFAEDTGIPLDRFAVTPSGTVPLAGTFDFYAAETSGGSNILKITVTDGIITGKV